MADNLLQGRAGDLRRMDLLRPFFDADLGSYVPDVSQKHQASRLLQMSVDGADGAAERAVDGNTQCRCLAVHRAASPQGEVRVPK